VAESRRAVLLAGAALWYDAAADRADMEVLDQYAVPDTLMDEVGFMEWLRSDREMTDGDWLR
jgi:hypothetical protein